VTRIDEYLAQLRERLAGADPAVAQDALYDAEEYLRAEAPDGDEAAVDAAIERYGSPDEIATAYLEAERRVSPVVPRTNVPARPLDARGAALRFFGVVGDARAWGSLLYLLLALATGIAYFTFVVTGLSLSAGFAVLIIGIPFMLLFLAMVRAVSLMEGRLVEALLGVRMPRRPRGHLPQGNLLERIKMWLTDVRTWTSMLYMVLQLPLGIAYFTVVVTLLSTSAAFVLQPIWQLVTGEPYFMTDRFAYYLQPWAIPLSFIAGILGFFATMHLARLVGRAHAAYAKAMLVGRAEDTASAPAAA